MSETKHTPGPWHVKHERRGAVVIEREDGIKIAQVVSNVGAKFVSHNARLIAAAPDLLESLSFYMAICGNTCYQVSRETAQEMHDKGKAAIAKALGE